MLFQLIVLALGPLNSLRLIQLIYYVWVQPYLIVSVILKRLHVPPFMSIICIGKTRVNIYCPVKLSFAVFFPSGSSE